MLYPPSGIAGLRLARMLVARPPGRKGEGERPACDGAMAAMSGNVMIRRVEPLAVAISSKHTGLPPRP